MSLLLGVPRLIFGHVPLPGRVFSGWGKCWHGPAPDGSGPVGGIIFGAGAPWAFWASCIHHGYGHCPDYCHPLRQGSLSAVQQLSQSCACRFWPWGPHPPFWWLIIKEVRLGYWRPSWPALAGNCWRGLHGGGGNVRCIASPHHFYHAGGKQRQLFLGLALSFVLLLITYSITYLLTVLQQRRRQATLGIGSENIVVKRGRRFAYR